MKDKNDPSRPPQDEPSHHTSGVKQTLKEFEIKNALQLAEVYDVITVNQGIVSFTEDFSECLVLAQQTIKVKAKKRTLDLSTIPDSMSLREKIRVKQSIFALRRYTETNFDRVNKQAWKHLLNAVYHSLLAMKSYEGET